MKKQKIVGIFPDGKPMTQNDLIAQIELGEHQIDNGEFYTIQELKNLVKQWFNVKT